jgi:hypothetical protein
VPDRLVVGRGDIAEGLYELAALHHKRLVELIQHLSDFAQQRIEQAQHPYQQIGDRTHLAVGQFSRHLYHRRVI